MVLLFTFAWHFDGPARQRMPDPVLFENQRLPWPPLDNFQRLIRYAARHLRCDPLWLLSRPETGEHQIASNLWIIRKLMVWRAESEGA